MKAYRKHIIIALVIMVIVIILVRKSRNGTPSMTGEGKLDPAMASLPFTDEIEKLHDDLKKTTLQQQIDAGLQVTRPGSIGYRPHNQGESKKLSKSVAEFKALANELQDTMNWDALNPKKSYNWNRIQNILLSCWLLDDYKELYNQFYNRSIKFYVGNTPKFLNMNLDYALLNSVNHYAPGKLAALKTLLSRNNYKTSATIIQIK